MAEKDENVGLAFGLVAAAGLSTTIGAAMVFFDRFFKKANFTVLGAALGFSSGVMFYVSMIEIFSKSIADFEACECLWETDEGDYSSAAFAMATVCFFLGVLLTYALDFVVHLLVGHYHLMNESHEEKEGLLEEGKGRVNFPDMVDRDVAKRHPVETHVQRKKRIERSQSVPLNKNIDVSVEEWLKKTEDKTETVANKRNAQKLNQMGIMTALAIGLHNFPEGLATFVATLSDPSVGASLAVAIAIHNIPEGLCVAVPIFYSSGSRWKGFWLAFWSGISELIGAALGYFFLKTVLGKAAYGILFGVVAGMMVTIVIKELLPTAHRYDVEDKLVSKSTFVGAFVMALSLVLFTL